MKDKQKKIRSSLSTRAFADFYAEHDNILKEGLIALLICAVGDLIAGIILGKMTFFLETFPGLLVIIPGAIGMRGNIFGSFASRLSTNLHIGMISPKFEFSEHLNNNIISSFVLTLILSLFLAILAKIFCILFNYESISLIDLVLISVIAGIISNLIMLPITMLISFKSFNHGWDPDNVTTPIIAAAGDLFTLPAIIASVYILSFLNTNLSLKNIVFIIAVFLIIAAFIYTIKRGEESKKIIYQSTPILILCSILGVSAGGILNGSLETLLTNHSLLTLLPLFSGVSGSLISILSARLSSGLHYGLIEPLKRPTGESIHNFLICYILALVMYPLIGFIAEDSTGLMGLTGVGFVNIMSISFISGFLLLSLMIFVVYLISITSYNKDLDPDNIVIPISTSVTDVFSSLTLITISLLILGALI